MKPPLAEQLRPANFEEVVGQQHLLGKDGFITQVVKAKTPLSVVLWGPPGCGKTSIARLYARAFAMRFETISAVFSGIADIKKLVKETQNTPLFSSGLVLFVDEIHRFNKAQQDAFLPFIEDGTLILIGATTENPSFYLNHALLSRLRVLQIKPLNDEAMSALIEKYEAAKSPLNITEEGKKLLISLSHSDGRYLLNLIENIETCLPDKKIDLEELRQLLQERPALYDKGGDNHYNLISALHKAIRGSDPDAAMYWFARMLEGGEDPLFIARRLIRMSVEDIGLADPQALSLAIHAREAFHMLGSPEGELALAEVVIYLALAPKSNATYMAYKKARELAKNSNQKPPPSIILNAPTNLMKQMGYGDGYAYDHDTKDAFSGQHYFPEGVEREEFYSPVERGFEREMKKRIDYFKKLRQSL